MVTTMSEGNMTVAAYQCQADPTFTMQYTQNTYNYIMYVMWLNLLAVDFRSPPNNKRVGRENPLHSRLIW